jgi:hypothetical protein
VDKKIGIEKREDLKVYLYNLEDARTTAERLLFFRSLSTCKIKIKGKALFSPNFLNDRVFIEFDRLFKRYGALDRRKIGLITSITKNGLDTEIELSDLGNIFNRVPVYAPTSEPNFSGASEESKIKYGYYCDNETLTPDVSSEDELGNNLYG